MSDLIVVGMIDEYTEGKQFTHWGRHLTVVPYFEHDTPDVIHELLEESTRGLGQIVLRFGDLEMVGPKHDIPAKFVVDNERLQDLHRKIIANLSEIGVEISGRYTGSHYRPHVSVKRGNTLDEASVTLHSIQLAESLGQGYRKILSSIAL
jgi:hypothetical protein